MLTQYKNLITNKLRIGRYQFKIALSYLAVISVVLALLNTYPILVTQDFVFKSKQTAMYDRTTLIAGTLSAFDELTAENTARVMSLLPGEDSSQVVISDPKGVILYDDSQTGNTANEAASLPEMQSALSGNDVFFSRSSEVCFESITAGPVMSLGRVIGAVYVYNYDTEQAKMLSDLRANMMNFTIFVTAFVIVLSIFLSVALTRRLGELIRAIGSVRDGKFDHRTPVRGSDELAQVTLKFNELTERLQETEELRHRFVSDASHELKTPLASIRLLTDSILQTNDMDATTVHEFVSDIGEEIDRLSRMTEKLMTLTRIESTESVGTCVSLDSVAGRAVRMLEPLAEHAHVNLEYEYGEGCDVLAVEDDIYQVVYNLVENAIKYNKTDGVVRVLLYAKRNSVYLIVDDTGPGIPAADLPRIFERFYRVDKARTRDAGGSGLGLSIVRHTVQSYGGTVEATSEQGSGTRFTVTFPQYKKGEAL